MQGTEKKGGREDGKEVGSEEKEPSSFLLLPLVMLKLVSANSAPSLSINIAQVLNSVSIDRSNYQQGCGREKHADS